MKAVQFDAYGDIDVLAVRELPLPEAGPTDVVIEVRAAGINPGEASIRSGALESMFPATFPSGQGSDVAGVISEVGSGVTDFAVGDEVLGWCYTRASHAEYVVVPADQLVAKPADVPWAVAGALHVVGCTAYAAVRAVGAGDGDIVAVSAAAGGVGTVVVQLLRAKGATVLGIASEANAAWLTAKGVTPVAYGDDLAGRLTAAAPAGIDAFIDLYGPAYLELAVSLGVARDRIDTIIAFAKAAELGTKAEGSSAATTTAVLGELVGMVAAGTLEIPIAATYPLEQVREAFTELEKGHTRGKIVLLP